jgi:hypothetical protein
LCWYEARRDAKARGEDPDAVKRPQFLGVGGRSPIRSRADLHHAQARNKVTGWDLLPGDSIRRVDLHARYGGSGQGGISPCADTPNVLLFSEPAVGAEHGYFDHWDGDVFAYCGEGQRGDQEFIRGNAAIFHHNRDGRHLRVFEGVRGTIRYAGEFELDATKPYYWAQAPATGGGPMRKVIMFRLLPLA